MLRFNEGAGKAPIDFSIRRQRKLYERDDRRWNHIIPAPPPAARDGGLGDRRPRHRVEHIGDQPFISGTSSRTMITTACFTVESSQHRFDFPELDPEPAQFHLIVDPADVLPRPSGNHFTWSPVRYIRSPERNRFETKRSAVN